MANSERTLFPSEKDKVDPSAPLAERMRPRSISEVVGQAHLLGDGKPLSLALANDTLQSLIFWGPPGSGKTTIARVIANTTKSRFVALSAVLDGVKELRAAVDEAEKFKRIGERTIIFIDEIHRFSKSQQDALLPFVERGSITLIGATTENPSFSIIPPLISRVQVMTLESLGDEDIKTLALRALADKERGIGKQGQSLSNDALAAIIQFADGDARRALTALEAAEKIARQKKIKEISKELVSEAAQHKALFYDKDGEEHYNIISAFIKSLRGSDPDAATYWMVRMLESGEDPLFIVRRMVIFAAEDIGVAEPRALMLATSCLQAVHFIGLPEAVLPMTETAVFLATCPKCNSALATYTNAKRAVTEHGALPVPMHIRNAPTKLMRELGYGKGYKYPHNFEGNYVPENYLPPEIAQEIFYKPGSSGEESEINKRLAEWRKTTKNKNVKEPLENGHKKEKK